MWYSQPSKPTGWAVKEAFAGPVKLECATPKSTRFSVVSSRHILRVMDTRPAAAAVQDAPRSPREISVRCLFPSCEKSVFNPWQNFFPPSVKSVAKFPFPTLGQFRPPFTPPTPQATCPAPGSVQRAVLVRKRAWSAPPAGSEHPALSCPPAPTVPSSQ